VILRAPVPLSPDHEFKDFQCGEPQLDDWLQPRALANHTSGATRCFVSLDEAHRVMGYYALAAGAVTRRDATTAVRRNMPEPVPVMVLARLAVDLRARGRRLGGALLRDAWQRCKNVSREAGVRAMLVHALDERACGFYERYGFVRSPIHPLTLMLPLATPLPAPHSGSGATA
jgi:GNAT superfamily N-acetyltransferase